MRRNRLFALTIAWLIAAFAAAQTTTATAPSTHHAKPHHSTVHHPTTQHPKPPANPTAVQHKQLMKQETATRERDSRTSTEGKSSLRSEKEASSARRSVTSREAHLRRKHGPKSRSVKKHPHAVAHTVSENRLELERREEAERKSRYEEGFRAGFAAGLAARHSEAESTCAAPPVDRPASRGFASRPYEPDARPAEQTHISDATVRSSVPVSGDGPTPAVTAAPAREVSHPPAEKASLELAPGAHVVPLSLKASLQLLHEPVPAPMRGTLASLERQNQRLDAEGVQRIEDQSDLDYRVAHRLLVPLPASSGLTINPELPVERRFCRPWTAEFLTDLATMHDAVFHRPLRVDSAVRTVNYQRRLIEINANAAPAEGDIASPHETGATIDIAKRGMTWREIGWMRRYLMTLQNAGLIDVEEEFYQSCFHITVYDSYGRRGLVREAGTGSGTDRTSDTAANGTIGQ
jgi:hypothetical protein